MYRPELNTDPDIWRESFFVTSFQVDHNRKATPETLMMYLQEVAVNQGMNNGFGYYVFYPEGKRWIMLRISVEIDEFPVWEEEVWVETWIRENKRQFFIRDFYIRNSAQEIIGKASACYSLLDIKSRKTQNLKFMDDLLRSYPDKISLDCAPRKVPEIPSAVPVFHVRSRFSDIDLNGHVNSIRYAQWMLDGIPAHLRAQKELWMLDINFTHEMFLGEEAGVTCLDTVKDDREFLTSVVRIQDDAEICRARIMFR